MLPNHEANPLGKGDLLASSQSSVDSGRPAESSRITKRKNALDRAYFEYLNRTSEGPEIDTVIDRIFVDHEIDGKGDNHVIIDNIRMFNRHGLIHYKLNVRILLNHRQEWLM